MTKSKIDYNQKETNELQKFLAEKEKELIDANIAAEQRKSKDVHAAMKVRKEIAKIKTSLRMKKLGG